MKDEAGRMKEGAETRRPGDTETRRDKNERLSQKDVSERQRTEDGRRKTADGTSNTARHPLPPIPNSEFPPTCPFCSSPHVGLFSMFGSQLLTSEYYCRACRTVFESVKR